MKNRRVIIHVGFPKTGSTALQYALFNTHSEEYLYPTMKMNCTQNVGGTTLSCDFKTQPDHNMSFASLFKDDFGKSDYYGKGIIVDKDLGLALRDNLKQYINKVLTTPPRKDIIFSSENVFILKPMKWKE